MNSTQRMGRVDFSTTVRRCVPDMSKEQGDVLFDWLDGDRDQFISFSGFLSCLMGGLSDRRRQMILRAFQVDTFLNTPFPPSHTYM